jgi:leader peptidase (prepilin peptidase) / N-methyltransferase
VLICLRFGLTPEAAVWFAFAATLLLISFIDLDFQIIPDVISIPGIVIFSLLAYFVLDMPISAIGYGIVTGGGILYAVALVYYLIRRQEGMGGGDIKLLAMIGAVTGVPGVLFTLFAGSVFGTIVGIGRILLAPENGGQTKIPFGPFLSAGAMLYMFYGSILINWYM